MQASRQQDLHGMVPPQAISLEEYVLGNIIDRGLKNLFIASTVLSADDFYTEVHKTIYSACVELAKSNSPIDCLSLYEQLKSTEEIEKIGGIPKITELTTKVVSDANLEYHCRIIKQKSDRRKLIALSSELISSSYGDTENVHELMDKASLEIDIIRSSNQKGVKADKKKVFDLICEDIANAKDRGMVGDPFIGIDKIDLALDGIESDDYIVIAARPGMGKSVLSNTIACHYGVEQNKNVLFWGLEMSNKSNMRRAVANVGNIYLSNMKNGSIPITDAKLERAGQSIINSNLEFVDTVGVNAYDIKSKAISMKQNGGLDLIIIDWGGLLNDIIDKGTRNDKITETSRQLRIIAKQVAPVVLIWQLSKEVERRPDKQPQLSDLRDSGAIEQDATKVMFLTRPHYYGWDEFEFEGETQKSKGLAILNIAKNRDGAIGKHILKFVPEHSRFEDFEPDFKVIDNTIKPSDRGEFETDDDMPF